MILPLEQQVCSLESSKKLKEIGFRQESLFYWIKCKREIKGENPWEVKLGMVTAMLPQSWDYDNRISAYTVAELGELLPTMGIIHCKSNNGKGSDFWWSKYSHNGINFISESYTEAEARAKMLIYLVTNGLMEVPK